MRPSRDEVQMHTAWAWAARGTCSRATVGAVISREGRPLVTGYNGAPAGLPHCSHECDCTWKGSPDARTSRPLHTPSCAVSLGGCGIAVHAEANAVAYAARHGIRLGDAEMHSTRAPCPACSMLIINAGIRRVVYDEDYRDMGGIRLLLQAGLTVERFADMISR